LAFSGVSKERTAFIFWIEDMLSNEQNAGGKLIQFTLLDACFLLGLLFNLEDTYIHIS
jgi:hypothetical protein